MGMTSSEVQCQMLPYCLSKIHISGMCLSGQYQFYTILLANTSGLLKVENNYAQMCLGDLRLYLI